MRTIPDVSVVMAVRNGGDSLNRTIDSVLAQSGVLLEFIIVNDGSTDQTEELLERWAQRDQRVRVFHQDNAGLTRSLIRGCLGAAGAYIARQDAGDLSLPGRLEAQLHELAANPRAVMTSCATQFVGPDGRTVQVVAQRRTELHEGLGALSLRTVRGPSHHGSVLFRRSTYESVGGYRPEFEVAQDLDLWMRLREVGQCLAGPTVLYQATLNADLISQRRRKYQVAAARAIIECAALRRLGASEVPALQRWSATAAKMRPGVSANASGQEARFYYYLGCLLRKRDPRRARIYFQRAFKVRPLSAKTIYQLLRLRPSR